MKFTRLINPSTQVKYDVPAPIRATEHSAGWDFYAAGREFLREMGGKLQPIPANCVTVGDLVKYNTGLALEIPNGRVGLAFARSSVCKMPLALANGTGVIDADYRGELSFIFRILDAIGIEKRAYQIGDRVGQLVIVEHWQTTLEEVDSLEETKRGAGGYGSTGK